MAETTHRVLRLLSLLESRPVWAGPELAERLAVTTRTVRRDVERLRGLGYPVAAEPGVSGGYRLGAGGKLPPLLLDDDEAVAVAVCLRLGAGESVEGVAEAAMRTLAKLDQVLPARLRGQVEAVQSVTVTLPGVGPAVDPQVLVTLARGARDGVRVRFGYGSREGAASTRDVEPYRLVATGRRWYLLAWDPDREDWRTFRLDRMSQVTAGTLRFRRRPEPDAASYVQHALTQGGYRVVGRVRIGAAADAVRARVPATVGTVHPIGEGSCDLVAGADHVDVLAWHLAGVALGLDADLEVIEPDALAQAMRRVGSRVRRFGGAQA
ncbi:MAG: YafY family protein [Kineosporiaceae bacterium]